MKNLTVHSQSEHCLENVIHEDLHQLLTLQLLCCSNPDNDDLYLLKGDRLHVISPDNKDRTISMKIDIDNGLVPVGLEYCSISQQIYCAYDSGNLVRISTEDDLKCEIVACVIGGLRCMKLSSDHEIIVLATSRDTVVTMTANFDIVAEVELNLLDFGEKAFMTVGWGKKETQFHGSEGKAAAKVKPTIVGQTELDDGLPRITWRDDGTLFAVGFLHKENKTRRFKVFNREGILQYTSEPTSGLEENLSWKPSGSLIASTQKLPNKHVVALFEKNGLKHREFSLPFEVKEIIVKNLLWSQDSDVLTIWCESIETGKTIVQLWTENNYHWYLKQTITFSKKNPLIYLTWSSVPRSGKKLFLLTKEKLITYSFRWAISHSRGKSLADKAIVGVIDGDRALLTGFRVGIVPPPMAHQALHIHEPINEIVFAPDNKNKNSWVNSNTLFCVLHDNKLAFYKHTNDPGVMDYGHVKSYDIEWDVPKVTCESVPYSTHHFLWFKEDTILCSVSSGTFSFLCILHLSEVNPEKGGRVAVREACVVAGLIEHILPSPDPEVAYLMVDGSILKYKEDEGIIPTEIQILEPCCHIEVVEIGKRHVIVSLSNKNRLYIDDKEVASNIKTFYVHTKFLLLTTLQHTLICIALDERGFAQLRSHNLTVIPWEDGCADKTSIGLSLRRVERGSNLIIAIPEDTRTILQMPRGNLECIQPRALSLHIIGTLLDDLDYFAAFDLMRKQRININLIFDHDPSVFMDNAVKFVEDIKNPNWLSLFLSDLQQEDVTITTYASCYVDRLSRSAVSGVSDKVERVCKLLRNIMEGRADADRLILPILVSLVKGQKIKDLESALRKVKEVRILEDSKEDERHVSSEEALKYLLYLIDVNVLFNVALGMYDFDLTMFVASKSQKDPKEYIPFLNDLKKLEENYMRYSIDKYLKRYESALVHISKRIDKFNECVDLICNHNLYVQALKLFNRESTEYKEVARIYGKFLENKKNYQEAGIMFCRSGDLEKALNAYKLAGCWQEVIVVAIEMKLSYTDLHTLYEDLTLQLKDEKRYREAAEIFMNHLHRLEDTVAILCEGREWRDAMRLAYFAHRTDLIETHVKPGIQEHVEYIAEQISRNKQDFEKYRARLVTVRAEKSARRMELPDGDEREYEVTGGRGDSDLFSDTSSIAGSVTSLGSQSSRSSGRSYRSSKNRRKQERKFLSLKEGSAFEDLALIRVLHQIVTKAYTQRDEVNLVMQMLLHLNNDGHAERLQNSLSEFLNIIEGSKYEIWPKQLFNNSFGLQGEEMYTNEQNNIPHSLLEPHLMYAPVTSSKVWRLDILSSPSKIISNT